MFVQYLKVFCCWGKGVWVSWLAVEDLFLGRKCKSITSINNSSHGTHDYGIFYEHWSGKKNCQLLFFEADSSKFDMIWIDGTHSKRFLAIWPIYSLFCRFKPITINSNRFSPFKPIRTDSNQFELNVPNLNRFRIILADLNCLTPI